MLSSKVKRKRWHDMHCRKLQHQQFKRSTQKKHHRHYHRRKHIPSNKLYIVAPEQLSLSSNLKGTLDFFNQAIDAVTSCSFNQTIYFDLSLVTAISPEVIMYIIAIIKNTKRLKSYRVQCTGNLPTDNTAKAYIEETGFYSYVSGLKQTREKNHEKIQIAHGREADGLLAARICDFVNVKSSGHARLKTKQLYPTIIELMTNTNQHAYQGGTGIMNDNWYIYAESTANSVNFIFLDTGVGIPTTIRRNFAEQIGKYIVRDKNDAKFIASALLGEFRSETGLEYRGKGLPGIYETAKSGYIERLQIISGRGCCTVANTGDILEDLLPSAFNGTLVKWSFPRTSA